jgi:hypothetical protein
MIINIKIFSNLLYPKKNNIEFLSITKGRDLNIIPLRYQLVKLILYLFSESIDFIYYQDY